MKTLYTLCIFMVLSMQQTHAQTYTFNWATSFVTSWLTGVLSGNANNVNSSSVNVTVSMTSNETPSSSAFTNFTAFSAPIISVGGSPITTQLGSNVPNIVVGANFSNKANYADIVITFNTAVKNVTFNIADIDKNLFVNDYYDQVTVTGTNSGTPVTNPTLTKLVSGSNYFSISGNTA